MMSFILLLCLAQLWGCQSAAINLGQAFRQPNCDDPETEQAALAAVDYINSNIVQGYKHTLNQIDKVKVWSRRPLGEVFELELDTLETICYALDPEPVANCSVRPLSEHAVEGDCDFQVLKQDGKFSVLFAKCDSSPDSAEDVRKLCPDCPLLAPLNDSRVVHAAEAALRTFNAQSNGSYLQVVEVSRGQIVPLPPSTYVEFAVAATDCVAQEVADPAKCNLLAEKQYGFCKAMVTEKVGGEDVAVTCTMFQTQPVVPQPQPDGAADALVTPPAAQLPPANPALAALLVAPKAGATLQGPLVSPSHYDLRFAFGGVASVESASGEAFHGGKVQPSIPVAAGPVVRPCPGRIRHFEV